MNNGWTTRPQQPEYLFDLIFDPCETCNLAADPSHAAELADMRGRLDRWMARTNDPLLTGRVKPWPGMLVNDTDGLSPQEPAHPID